MNEPESPSSLFSGEVTMDKKGCLCLEGNDGREPRPLPDALSALSCIYVDNECEDFTFDEFLSMLLDFQSGDPVEAPTELSKRILEFLMKQSAIATATNRSDL